MSVISSAILWVNEGFTEGEARTVANYALAVAHRAGLDSGDAVRAEAIAVDALQVLSAHSPGGKPGDRGDLYAGLSAALVAEAWPMDDTASWEAEAAFSRKFGSVVSLLGESVAEGTRRAVRYP